MPRPKLLLLAGIVFVGLIAVACLTRERALLADTKTKAPPAPSGSARPTKGPRYPSVLIEGVPCLRQKPDFCGEACAAMYLRRLGQDADQDYVFDRSGLDPSKARGCYTKELAEALKNIGFRTGDVWHKIAVAQAPRQMERQWAALHADLLREIPSIVCMRYDARPGASEHFRLVLGYDAPTDEVIYHEPAEPNGAYRRMPRGRFLELWPLKYANDTWTVIRLRLEPACSIVAKSSAGLTGADYAQHLMKLAERLPGKEFHVVLASPFVVIGDESAETLRRRAKRTVQWATDMLKQDYFKKDPAEILEIWLFKDKASYERHAAALFRAKPGTPFGYFSHTDRALVMNIATGGGTLVHEMVHAFMEPNFPTCPAWFNEGLASLYEQCGAEDGHIHGYTNWRLAGLQKAIRGGRVPSFKTLCSTSTHEFYEEDPGTNYAQARYLCYWLQQHGLLRTYFHRFRAAAADDPTGYQTLMAVLDRKDMEAFKRQWEAYVLKLSFP